MALLEQGPAWGSTAPILVLHFDGAIDAGAAGHIAVRQMLNALHVERVATFNSDDFVDYRAHRPVMTVEDWVARDIQTPVIALDRVDDDLGRPFLLLHGPEPDLKWDQFAAEVAKIAQSAGVEISISLHGVPAGTPHTRPTHVHIQATDASLVPKQPHMLNPLQFPAPVSSFSQMRMSAAGVQGMALLGAVPFYMSDRPYPAASSALLRRLAEITGLTLPVGDLEMGAAEETVALDRFLEDNPEVMGTVKALETHYDAIAGEEGIEPLGSLEHSNQTPPADDSSSIGDIIEAYLANVTRTAGADFSNETDPDTSEDGDADAGSEPVDTIEEVLRRVALRAEGIDPYANGVSKAPRHRAQPLQPTEAPPESMADDESEVDGVTMEDSQQ